MKNLRVTEKWLQEIVEYINYNLYSEIDGAYFKDGRFNPFFEGQYFLDRSDKGYDLYKRDENLKVQIVGSWSEMTARETYCVLQAMQQGIKAQKQIQEAITI